MKTKSLCLCALFTLTLLAYGQRYETFVLNGRMTNTLEISEYETVKLVSFFWGTSAGGNDYGRMTLLKGGFCFTSGFSSLWWPARTFDNHPSNQSITSDKFVVRGPATLTI